MHVTTHTVEATTQLEAEKAAATAATEAGQVILMVGAPEKGKDDKWDVPVTVEGDDKKSKKAKLKIVKESDKE